MNKNIEEIRLWTAIVTPMLENGEVDLDSFETLLNEQEKAGNGILILGSTGESLNLDETDQKNIVNFTMNKELKVPIMVGVGGINLHKTTRWVSFLEGHNIDAYLMVTPLYSKPGPIGQYEWFKELMDEVSKPVILYNVPSRAGISLPFETVSKLKDHPNFYGIKEASGSVEDFKKYVEAAGPKAKVFSGDDALMPEFSREKAYGLISVASNVWPVETALYVEKCLDNSLKAAKMWKDCSNSLFEVSNPIPAKMILHAENRITSPILRPPLTHKEMGNSDNQKNAGEQIRSWYKKLKE